MVVLNPAGVPGLLAGAFTLAMAALVYFSRPRRAQNRRLALVLYFEGVLVGTGVGLLYMMDTPQAAFGVQAVGVTARLLLPVLYLWFLATLDTPLVAPLRTRPGLAALVLVGVSIEALWFLNPGKFISGVAPTWYAPYEGVRGEWYGTSILFNAAFYFFGLAVAISAYFHARTESSRQRAKWFAIAFGTRDLAYGVFQFVRVFVLPYGDVASDLLTFLGAPVLWLVYVPLLAYGILRTQLFDIEVKVKRGTVAALLVALGVGAYALLAGLLDALLGPLGLGGAVPQALAAGLVVLAATRVRGVARALGDALFPGVREDDPTYLQQRRLQVYHAALEGAVHEDPGAGEEALRGLRRALGVSEREHALLLAEVQGLGPSTALAAGGLFLGRYRVVRRLGQGAFGEVFLARDERLGRDVVLKRLLGQRLRDAAALKRFQREMRLASALHHPRIIAVYDVEVVGDAAYLVMEHAPGGSLAERLRQHGPLREDEALQLALDLLDALAALHGKGIVHRDIKPSNVLLDAQGRAKLGDFGIAQDVVSGDTAGATGPGATPGTLAYMAPEQARGLPASPASDLYALAATLYEALTAQPPIDLEGLGDFEARLRIVQGEPALPLPELASALNEALGRALAKDPGERFPDAESMADALRGVLAAPAEMPGAAPSRLPPA